MMKYVLIILALLIALAPGASANSLPSEFSYTILIEGKESGKSQTKVTETSDRLIFDTNSFVNFGEYKLEINTRVEADKKTSQILKFSYEGEKPGILMGGEAIVSGDTIHGFSVENGVEYPVSRVSTHPNPVFLEDYVMVCQVLLARAYFNAKEDPWATSVFLPTSWIVNDRLVIAKAADAYLESDIKETTCTKLQVQFSGSHAFVSFFDHKRGLPVYLAFPGTNTEAFLDEFYGDTPVSRYMLSKEK